MRSRQDQVILIFAIWTDTYTDADAGDSTFATRPDQSERAMDGRVRLLFMRDLV